MRIIKSREVRIMKLPAALVTVFLLSVAVTTTPQSSLAKFSAARDDVGARQAFAEAYKVFTSPRCLNCHPAGDSPLKGEDNQPHAGLRLRRGPDGQGVFTLKCTNCHQSHNQAGLNMPPGAPNVLAGGALD